MDDNTKEFETEYTRYITCPYCGCEDADSWEWGGDEINIEADYTCGSCGEEFIAIREVEVTYTTMKNKSGVIK